MLTREELRQVPREAVKIMSGFSDEVAIAVTHPLCPEREPKYRSDSIFLVQVEVRRRRQLWARCCILG